MKTGLRLCLTLRFPSLRTMASEAFFTPPASVRGMKVLNRAVFRREVAVPAIKLQPSLCSKFLQKLRHAVLKHPGIKTFVDVESVDEKTAKAMLLSPNQLEEAPLSEEELQWVEANGGEQITHPLTLDYQHYTKHAILRAVLPPEIKDVPSSFETVGHIAHLNLRDEQLPYKDIIGQVILDKQSNIRTVVNKTNSIDETFRFFRMELLAGDDDMMTTVRESDCTFTFDFSKVYWNSRLHTEHGRVVSMFSAGDVVVDMFAGVGPFAIPACKRGCVVYANDLNPHSYSALCENAKRNHVSHKLYAYNMDGREFIRTITRQLLDSGDIATQGRVYSHVIMNLPALAPEFLDTFKGLFREIPTDLRHRVKLPMVHCYCFSKSSDPDRDALSMVEQNLGVALGGDACVIFQVRAVAPNKVMMRISFQLPDKVVYTFGEEAATDVPGVSGVDTGGEPTPKRSRLD